MNQMETLETIENYLNGQLPASERERFETALRTDPAVADTLAFYVMTKEAARQQAREQRRAELDSLRQKSVATPMAAPMMEEAGMGRDQPVLSRPAPRSAPMRWVAAASVLLLLGLAWSVFRLETEPVSIAQLADTYITTHYDQLSTTMGGGSANRLEQGIGLYNEQKFAEAEAAFKDVLAQQPNNERALQFAGVIAYRQGKYGQAIDQFHKLSQIPDLISNPGAFLEALARLKRSQPMDKEQAKTLLQTVIQENLAGKAEAEPLVKQL